MTTNGWSGLWNGLVANFNTPNTGHSLLTRTGHRVSRKVAQLGRTRGGAVALGGEFALPGENYKRTVAPTDTQTNVTALGGARTVETIAPTQLSEADLITDVNAANKPTYPDDASGNGGGGKIKDDGSIRF